VTIALEDKEKLFRTVNVGDNGLILETFRDVSNKKDQGVKLKYYSADLELIWEVPIITHQMNTVKFSNTPLIASPNGEYVYHIESRLGYSGSYGKKEKYITRISRSGIAKTHTIKPGKVKEAWKFVFANGSGLHFLTTFEVKKHGKGSFGEKLVLTSLDHDFYKRRVVLKLPSLDKDKSLYWEYIGMSDKSFYVASRSKTKENAPRFSIVEIKMDGSIKNQFVINPQLDGKLFRASNCTSVSEGVENIKPSNWASIDVNGHSKEIPREGAYGQLVKNRTESCFYFYGLYKTTVIKNSVERNYSGVHIFKYDLSGQQVWTVHNEFPGKVKEYVNKSRNSGVPYSTYTRLISPDGEDQIFQIGQGYFTYNLSVSDDGKIGSDYLLEFPNLPPRNYMDFYQNPNLKLGALEYFLTQKVVKGKMRFSIYTSSNGKILIEEQGKEQKINLLYFGE